MTVVTCKSTSYGPGCGHPVDDHIGRGDCCCCNWQHNDPTHVDGCDRCRPILAAYVERRRVVSETLHAECGHAFGLCRYVTPHANGDEVSS